MATARRHRANKPKLLVVLFDDVGCSDLGCCGSTIGTPTIDALAARGVRMIVCHTTAMCSTTRAAPMPGCNHHRVDMGCLANVDSSFPGYRGKIAPGAATLAEMLPDAGDVNYLLVKSHVTPLSATGPNGFVNAMGPYNQVAEPPGKKFDRLDNIGGPDSHSNFPWGGAMAANTPLKRYKQNTHGGGIREPLIISWPKSLAAHGELRHGVHHATDLLPTLLALDGKSFAADLRQAGAPMHQRLQVFEMFGHRGLWQGSWKAVAHHPSGQSFDADVWELYPLAADFAESHDLAAAQPERPRALIDTWWQEAQRCQVLPLDDRYATRFADHAHRVQGARHRSVLQAGMGHLPTDVAPDVRCRGYLIEADVTLADAAGQGVLIAHGDAAGGRHGDGAGLPTCLAADRRRARGHAGPSPRLQPTDFLVGAGHRHRPRLADVALRRAVRVHRPAAQGEHHARPAGRSGRQGHRPS